MCAYIPILMWLLICYSPDAYRVPTVCARPYALSLTGKMYKRCGMDFATPMGGGAGGKWVNLLVCLCWPEAGVWGGSSVWVELRNPAALQRQEF